MVNIAVLGYGTVGSGVVEVINTNHESINKRAGQEINIKYVLDLRDFPGDPVQEVLVHDYEIIANDPEVDIVVEVMGGIEPAYTFVKRALESGKSVCTSNKALVAKHGPELMEIAKEKNINYMMYKMATEGSDFDVVLKEAQQKGYAEADPTADVEGYDACRKIAILSSLAYGKFLNYEDVYTEGITKITPEDMVYAEELGMTIKLLGTSRKLGEDTFTALVAPFLVGQKSPLYSVNDVFNAVFVHGNMLGDAMFYGSGAGKLPTASAVVADVVDEAKNLHENIATNWSNEPMKLTPMEETEGRFFVRVKGVTEAQAETAFGKLQIVKVASLPDEFGFITECMKQKEYKEKISKLNGEVIAMIRVKD